MRYYDDKGNINKDLLSTEAERIAQSFIVRDNRGNVDNRNSITPAQLRRFYGEFKGLEKKLLFKEERGDKDAAFLSVLPLVKMVKSKIAYARNPRNPKIPSSFADWMNRNVDAIEKAPDFKAFMLHFEAVVGFCYGFGLSNS